MDYEQRLLIRAKLIELAKTQKQARIDGEADWKRAARRRKIRCIHLSYAFVKGMPYKNVEKTCREDERPTAYEIGKTVLHELGTGIDIPPIERWLCGEEICREDLQSSTKNDTNEQSKPQGTSCSFAEKEIGSSTQELTGSKSLTPTASLSRSIDQKRPSSSSQAEDKTTQKSSTCRLPNE